MTEPEFKYRYSVESYDSDFNLEDMVLCEWYQDTYTVPCPLHGHQIVRHLT